VRHDESTRTDSHNASLTPLVPVMVVTTYRAIAVMSVMTNTITAAAADDDDDDDVADCAGEAQVQ